MIYLSSRFNIKNNLKWLVILCFFSSFSQNKNINSDILFTRCEIKFADGLIKEGYIRNFLEHSENKEFEDFLYSSIEKELGLLDNEFEFKTKLDENPITVKQKDVSEVKLYFENNNYLTYKLMNIKTLNDHGEIISSSKKAWLPLYKNDVISIFAFNLWYQKEREKSNGKIKVVGKPKKERTIIYLSDSMTDNAFCIYKSDELSFFKPSNHNKYTVSVLMEIFKDNPAFLSKIINDKKQWNYKLYDTPDNELEEEIKKVKNDDLLTNEERKNRLDILFIKEEAHPFSLLIEDYKSNFYKKK